MTKERERKIESLFRNYKANVKALKDDYGFPSVSAIDFSRLAVQTDKSKNIQEDKIIDYTDRKTGLYAQVYIVEEVIRYFVLEGHGRERFVRIFFIDGCSWVKTEMECHVTRGALSWWRKEVFEKAETVAEWINYF